VVKHKFEGNRNWRTPGEASGSIFESNIMLNELDKELEVGTSFCSVCGQSLPDLLQKLRRGDKPHTIKYSPFIEIIP